MTGETGTGKELIARLIHDAESNGRAFVAVNCAAVPETLFEREFFGHGKGAFTGADSDKAGLCEAANGGTLLLDEIGEMPVHLQVKLLRLLQEGTFRRLGEPQERQVDLRIIAATNAPLPELIREKRFRQDLFYRLQILEIHLPPLRERAEDIDPLLELFVARAAGAGIKPEDLFDEDVMAALRRYPWPGNVRELESMSRRLALLALHTGRASLEMLPPEVARWREQPSGVSSSLSLALYLERAEKERIVEALTRTEGNRSEAARALGISRNTLYKKMERLGIRIPA
jgi:transcriptional regulator with PAS, ATPase and Fis domain